MIGVALQEERYQASAHAEFSDAEIKARLDRLEKVKQFLGQLTMVAVVFLSIAGEAAAGIAYHEYRRHIIVVRTVRPFYAERARIVDALVENATLQEEARQRPEILHARLTAAALREEEAAQRAAEREERRSQSVVPTLKWVAIGFLGLLFALVLVSLAMAEEDIRCITAVAIDLSTSTSAGEFDANLRAVEQLILGLSSATRVAIFPVNEASFSSVPLFVSLSPSQPGRFREYQEVWQAGTIRAWRSVMGRLEPRAPGSDIIGTLGRVALEFEDFPKAEKRLMLLSDMRQVGRGFNFEQTVGDPKRALERASRDGLVPKLTGVKVWVLGVHTEGVNERRWNELKAFWSEYFRRAGAELHAFTPNRQVTGS